MLLLLRPPLQQGQASDLLDVLYGGRSWARDAALRRCKRNADHLALEWKATSFEVVGEGPEGPTGWNWDENDKHNPRPEWLRDNSERETGP